MSQGSVYFENIAAPYTMAALTTYAKVAPTTTASGSAYNVTEATTSRLTYTGTATLPFNVFANISIDHAAGANRDVRVAVYKNGAKINGSVVISTTSSGNKQTLSIQADTTLATNDYVEVYAQNDGAAITLNVYTFQLMLESMTD